MKLRRPVNSDVMLLRIAYVIVVLLFAGHLLVRGQSGTSRDSQNVFHGVALTFVSQRCIPKDKVPFVGEDFIDFSDIITRFRLANTGSEEVFYLAEDVSKDHSPVGFQLARADKDHEWVSIYSPARGREGIFTGVGFKWRLLRPGALIEFEPEDMSDRRGEHATSVFVNTKPTNTGRVELISNVYAPVTCSKR